MPESKIKQLKIISAEKKVNPHGGLTTISCVMSNGSVLSYNPLTKLFSEEVPSLETLNEKLNEWLATQKK